MVSFNNEKCILVHFPQHIVLTFGRTSNSYEKQQDEVQQVIMLLALFVQSSTMEPMLVLYFEGV